MNAKIEQLPSINTNLVLNAENDGTVIYSNEASESLLNEWGVKVGGKLPLNIVDIVQRVISCNSPEKMEVKVGKRVYLVVFHPLLEQECVYISGFDISDQRELERKLWESEERFRSAFDDSAVGMALVGKDAHLLKVNDAFCRLLGYEKSEMEGSTFLDYTYPDDVEPSILAHKAVINREKPFLWIEKRYIHKDGRLIWCEVSSSPVFDSDGCIIYTVAHVQDITERKETEESLKKAYGTLEEKVKERTSDLEKAYRLLKESEKGLADAQRMAKIGNWDWNLITGEVYWSDEIHSIFERNPQESIATYTDFLNHIHPDDRDYVENTNKKALRGEPFDIDHRIILANGEEHTVHTKAEVIFNEENRPIRLKGIVQDITERKRVEEKLRESEERYRNIVETANEGIGIIDDKAVITYANRKLADMLGYTVEDGIGLPIWDFIGEECKNMVKMNMKKRLQGINESYEYKLVHKDSSPIWVFMSAKPLFNDTGKFMGIMSMFTDITKRKEAEESLANIEIARQKEIHHRIKNNLQVISSLLDLQAEKFKDKQKIKESEVFEAFRESQNRVISMALIHEELNKGGNADTLNFSQYIEELADNLFLTYRLGNTRTGFNKDIEEDIFFDMDTSVPLGIIVNELVSNSLKYAFPGRNKGEIRIKLHREEYEECEIEGDKSTSLILSVSDNGIGIPENLEIEDLNSLGLQLVTTLVDQLDGILELKRDNGTEFVIRFTVVERSKSGTRSSPEMIK